VTEFRVAPAATDLAWAAGFLDGEGHFGAYPRYVSLEALQTGTRAPLVKLQEMFGGALNERRGQRTGHVWKLSSPLGVRRALMLLLPYLVGKRRQGELLLLSSMTYTGQRGVRLEPEALKLRARHAADLKSERWGG
jgi:hypothetical protein